MTNLIDESGFAVRVAENEPEQISVRAFMAAWALKTHGCEPPESNGVVIGCWKDGVVVGSIALDFRDSEPFPVESLYGTDALRRLFPEGLNRRKIVQSGRWFSSMPKSPVSLFMARAIALYGLPRGATDTISDAKEYALKRFQELGFRVWWDEKSSPDLKQIPPEGLKYYDNPPRPYLFRVDLASIR